MYAIDLLYPFPKCSQHLVYLRALPVVIARKKNVRAGRGFSGASGAARIEPSPVEPFADHETRERLRSFAVAAYDFPRHFHVTGMNGHEPFIAFDPGTDRVPNASVFHKMNIALKLDPEQ